MNKAEQELWEVIERAAISQDERVNANTRGHVWKLNSRGHVDIDGSSDFHNHVTCEKCGYVYCIACYFEPPKPCTK